MQMNTAPSPPTRPRRSPLFGCAMPADLASAVTEAMAVTIAKSEYSISILTTAAFQLGKGSSGAILNRSWTNRLLWTRASQLYPWRVEASTVGQSELILPHPLPTATIHTQKKGPDLESSSLRIRFSFGVSPAHFCFGYTGDCASFGVQAAFHGVMDLKWLTLGSLSCCSSNFRRHSKCHGWRAL